MLRVCGWDCRAHDHSEACAVLIVQYPRLPFRGSRDECPLNFKDTSNFGRHPCSALTSERLVTPSPFAIIPSLLYLLYTEDNMDGPPPPRQQAPPGNRLYLGNLPPTGTLF